MTLEALACDEQRRRVRELTDEAEFARSRIHGKCDRFLSMRVHINGEEKQVEGGVSLGQLVEQLGMKADRVAVERNREIVPRSQWAETLLADGDRLEIVQFVGGGLDSCADSGKRGREFGGPIAGARETQLSLPAFRIRSSAIDP